MSRRKLFIEPLEARLPLAADFSGNGTVDAADLEVWKTGFGTVNTATQSTGDSDGDMDVDGADFLAWQRELGQSTAPPRAPEIGIARAIGGGSIEVTWSASDTATSYAVIRRLPDTETAYTIIAPNVVGTSYIDSGLTAGTLYEYRIIARRNPDSVPGKPVQVAADQPNLTAFRPQGGQTFGVPTPQPIYFPFPKWEVPEQLETNTALGPGIRINADDDNSNGNDDRFDFGTTVPGENDLIEVRVDRPPGSGNLVLNTGSRLSVYYGHDRSSPYLQGDPIIFNNNSATLFVEWTATAHGTESMSLADQATQTSIDTIVFHSFRSMVVVFGGNTQSPSDTDGNGSIGDPVEGVLSAPGNQEGIFDLASELYVTGWDVYAYNEEVDLEIPYEEVINAVNERFVEPDLTNFQGGGIGVMGYSQGGGAANDLIELLSSRDPEGDFITQFGCYVDGIERQIFPLDDPIPETDWPNVVRYMLNIFQRNPLPTSPFVGDYIPEGQNEPNTIIEEHNTTEDGGWNNDLNHRSIDDDIQVKQLIRTRLQQILINR